MNQEQQNSPLRLWERLGAHPDPTHGSDAVRFSVWAPGARQVSVTGDFCDWDVDSHPMEQIDEEGVHEITLPSIQRGARYKFAVLGADHVLRLKADPFGQVQEGHQLQASIIPSASQHVWSDQDWMDRRSGRDWRREPLSIYEVHLGGWLREPGREDQPISFRQAAPRLADHCHRFGFQAVELLPITEHPFTGSWGYGTTGYFAPTHRHGLPDDLRWFVNTLHEADIAVFLDWVPGHFPDDDFGLARFDGTSLFERDEPQRSHHPVWNSLITDLSNPKIREFFIENALYWIGEYHVDGLRVDAVSSMVWKDFGLRSDGEDPLPQEEREDRDAAIFLQDLNTTLNSEFPGCATFAEDDTNWPGVTAPVVEGGLGFSFKWNVGWAADTLAYFEIDPEQRQGESRKLTFPITFEDSEHFLLPLSHDEANPEKGSLLSRMSGEGDMQQAQWRQLLTYQILRPGKNLLFMGGEAANPEAFNHDQGLDPGLYEENAGKTCGDFLRDLHQIYAEHPAFWEEDGTPGAGFSWLCCDENSEGVFAFLRFSDNNHGIVLLNLSGRDSPEFRVGTPRIGDYDVLIHSDLTGYGTSLPGQSTLKSSEEHPWQNQPASLMLDLPSASALVLGPA